MLAVDAAGDLDAAAAAGDDARGRVVEAMLAVDHQEMDFVDVLLSLPGEDGKEHLDDVVIKALIQDMIAAAADTSSVTNQWGRSGTLALTYERRHRWTGRYEAHLWDKDWCNASQKKKGRQVYLGAYEDEEAAAHAYDLASLKYWGRDTLLNFPLTTYQDELKEMEELSREEYVGSLRRKSSGFARGVSKYRGVARHHHNGRWEARIGRVLGNKYLYLGTYATQEEAATAYDAAAIEFRGLNAVTNFDVSRYVKSRPSSGDPNAGSTPDNSNSSDHIHPTAEDAASLIRQHRKSAGEISPGSEPHAGDDSSSAPGHVLLDPPEFEQMLERASMADGTPTPPESDSRSRSRCSFPDDVKTYFECQGGDGGFADVDDFVFGGLDPFVSSMLQWELDC